MVPAVDSGEDVLDRLARGGKPNGLNRRIKAGTILVREYQEERYTVTGSQSGLCSVISRCVRTAGIPAG